MNSRQKLIQQQFLNNEGQVLKRLKSIYTASLNDVNDKISTLEFDIDRLQFEYDWAEDGAEKSKLQSQIQSKIYQKRYQKALREQLDGILQKMNDKAFTTVSEYLNECYDEGFIGTMYDLHGQGIPLIMPINQEAMVRAVQLDSKISTTLYKKMGENVTKLKRDIAAKVSRGIASGMSYSQVAQQIRFKMIGTYNTNGGAFGRALTIARTEGHRIQVQAGMDACNAAKDMGADVLKQWDSALDARTRPSHRIVDGEIRELDKPFSNGLQYPGDSSGGAAEVVNCRCALLQRAKWALDEEELETLKKRAEYYGLDKTENFEDFKKKYLKAVEQEESLKVNYDCEIAKKFGADYYDALHERVVNSPNQELAKVWKQYEAEIKVGDAKYKGHAHAMGSEIYLNGERDVKGSTWKKPYHIGFHESGHAIDTLARKTVTDNNSWGAQYYSSAYKDGLFPQTIKAEVNDWVNSVAKQMKQDFKDHAGDFDYFINKGYIGEYDRFFFERHPDLLKATKSMAYSAIEREIKALPPLAKADLSDILEGATGAKIDIGYGHGKSYWKKRTSSDGVQNGLATEAFAEMLDCTINNPESLETIKKYLPKSYGVFEEMIRNLIV